MIRVSFFDLPINEINYDNETPRYFTLTMNHLVPPILREA